MLKSVTIFLLLLLSAGCATARLSSGPPLALTHYDQAVNISVGRVIDQRQSANVGTIGAAGIKVKQADLVNIITNYVIQSLNTNMKINIFPVAEVYEQNAASVAKNSNADRVLSVQVKELKMFSSDAIMQSVEVNLDLDLVVYDKEGNAIYTTPIKGFYEKRIGITIVDKSTGELVESVVKEAVYNLVKDPGLKKTLGV